MVSVHQFCSVPLYEDVRQLHLRIEQRTCVLYNRVFGLCLIRVLYVDEVSGFGKEVVPNVLLDLVFCRHASRKSVDSTRCRRLETSHRFDCMGKAKKRTSDTRVSSADQPKASALPTLSQKSLTREAVLGSEIFIVWGLRRPCKHLGE